MKERLSISAELAAGRSNAGVDKLLLLLLNFIPLGHVAVIVSTWFLPFPMAYRVCAAIMALYLLPPIMGRIILITFRIPEGAIRIGSTPFFAWWTLLQLQTVFNRFPALEELLRLIPALYSNWLRLWGARIGRLTYWAPGTLILDRSFLEIGDDVVFGAGVRLNAHVLVKEQLLLGAIRIGSGAQVGGYSLLTAGTMIAENEATRAFLISPPFSHWKGGKRVREASH